MICYRDKSYCDSSDTCRAVCERRVTKEIKEAAQKRNLPICYTPMRGNKWCPGYTEDGEI